VIWPIYDFLKLTMAQ